MGVKSGVNKLLLIKCMKSGLNYNLVHGSGCLSKWLASCLAL